MKKPAQRTLAAAFLLAATLTPLAYAADPLPPVRVAPNGRTFITADNKPFFYLGDTAWCIFNHPTPADVDLYLDDRAAKGFTVIQGCIAVWDYRNRQNPDGQLPFVNGDPGQINDAYFKNVDAILDKAAARGLRMALLPFWTKNNINGQMIDTVENPDKMKAYCHYLAKRYASRNVFWVLGGDAPGTTIQPLTDAEAAGLIAGAKEAGVDKLMITYHPTGRQSSSFWFHDRPWLDFNSIQSGHFINTTNFRLVGDDFAKAPTKPTLDMEPAYENITNNLVRTNVTADTPRVQAVDIRRSAYLAVFAGAAGHTYGQGEVYEFFHVPANGVITGNAGWHALMEWKDALKLPASGQVQFVRYLIESRPQDRTPDQSLILNQPAQPAAAPAGPGNGRGPRENALTRIAAIRGDDRSFAFIYLPAGQTKLSVDLTKLAPGPLTAWWYDPRTGKATKTAAAGQDFTAPTDPALPATNADWVLVLDSSAKNYPEPGKH